MSYLISPEGFVDSPRAYFGVEFFRDPPKGFTIEWTDGIREGGLCTMVRDGKPCHEKCMAGVLVKLVEPQRVWRLTGDADTFTRAAVNYLHGYEAVWPD